MSKSLIIVESPAKTKTLKNFLGGKYEVEASMGHVRDLPKNRLGIDIDEHFKPSYVAIAERKNILSHLKELAAKADVVYLATDPDREGEAISWHLSQALKLKEAKRITFNEITKTAVTDALKNPRVVDEKLVDAQQARRILDRLVGYKLSPLLWSKVKKGLSAGRVQSVAVRLICDRERDILAFVPEEYWSITAKLAKLGEEKAFSAKLIEKSGKKIKPGSEADATQVLSDLQGAEYKVASVKEREQKRNPSAPFITSTLQQEASRKLGFTSKKTMSVAQELYEGINIGAEGAVGLITYMRTDSARIAGEAIGQAREFIEQEYGKEYLPSSPRQYKSRKSAQDAHEAIRPTSVFRRPEQMAEFLTRDQFRLYKLIWQRFVACQMEAARLKVVTADISAGQYTFRATGSTMVFPGFTVLYTEGKDNAGKESEEEDEQLLPALSVDEMLRLLELLPKQHFTEPPPRYTEATLVKALEERGIGRPSTYATIISTIQDRKYVSLEEKKFKPSDLGFTVTDLLVKHFPDIISAEFTAGVENKLDDIEEGSLEWVKLMEEFWGPFQKSLEDAKEHMESVKAPPKETGEMCPKCGRPLVIRESRYGEFVGCSGYPECKTIIAQPPKALGVKCPSPGCEGQIVEKRSKRGKTFYGCDKYPECDFVLWDKPLERPCPKCGSLLVEKRWYGKPQGIKCTSESCDYKESQKAAKKEAEAEQTE